MTIPGRRSSLAGGLLLGLIAGSAASGQVSPQGGVPAAAIPYTQRHAVFKPAFDIPTRRPLMETGFEFPTKPLFVRGYGGNLYGRGPREAFIPTGYGTGTIQPVGEIQPVRPRLFGRLRNR